MPGPVWNDSTVFTSFCVFVLVFLLQYTLSASVAFVFVMISLILQLLFPDVFVNSF